MEVHFKIIGSTLILLALVHIIFPKHFHWEKEFASVNLLNRQMMYVHTFFIALTVLLMGMLCLLESQALATTSLGKKISLGLGVFWCCRLFVQLFGYSSKLWKGKPTETFIHIGFTLLWIYFSAIFFLNAFQ